MLGWQVEPTTFSTIHHLQVKMNDKCVPFDVHYQNFTVNCVPLWGCWAQFTNLQQNIISSDRMLMVLTG